ncbi:MAG: hypothetical protein HY049_06800 [Acidobacteria bacterium]|nr:hypothetical protein [Acidobacteriota bacterium]
MSQSTQIAASRRGGRDAAEVREPAPPAVPDRAPRHPARPAAKPASESQGPRWAVGLLTAGLVVINFAGLSYYAAPPAVRVRHPLHAWLRASGYIGQSLGIISLALFLFLWLYPIRKRFMSKLAFTGRLPVWLTWHVAAGLVVPWAAATHAGWRFTGMIGLGYAALFVVYLSGLVGRYLYTRIPRQRTGVEMTRDDVAAEREQILFDLVASTGLTPSAVRGLLTVDDAGARAAGFVGASRAMLRDDLVRRRAARRLEITLSRRAEGVRALDRAAIERVVQLARREMALSQQIRRLAATQRAFGLWHALHKPVAVTAFVAVVVHVVVAIAVGATWFH